MTLEFLDFNTYTFVGGFTVQRGKDLIIPDSLVLSQTMLIKWQIKYWLVSLEHTSQIETSHLSQGFVGVHFRCLFLLMKKKNYW